MWLLPPLHKLVQLGTRGGGGGVGSSSLKTFEAYDPPALKRGGDPMVAGHYFRLVKKDTGASAKRKKNQSSPSFRKKQKTYVLYGF